MTSPAAGRLRVVTATDEHAAAMAGFFRKTWDPSSTGERVLEARRNGAAANPAFPGEVSPTFLAFHGSEVVGYLGSLPVRFWVLGRTVPGYWAKGLMVLPEYRNGPIGPLVVREASKQLPVLGSLAVNPPALRLFAASGLKHVGVLSNRLVPLRAGNIVRRLNPALLPLERMPKLLGVLVAIATRPGLRPIFSIGAGLGGRFLSLVRRAPGRGMAWDSGAELPSGVDALWESVRENLSAGVVRDSAHLRWRYGAPANEGYRYVAVRERGRLAGLGVVRAPRAQGDPRLHGIKVAVLSEVIADPSGPRPLRALVSAAEEVAAMMDADALLCSDTHAGLARTLSRYGALSLPANVNFLIRLPGGTQVPPLDQWWLTRGDGDADEVF